MKFDLRELMSRATRLTRSGDLRAATAAIQAALRRAVSAAPRGGTAAGSAPVGDAALHGRRRSFDPGDDVDVIDLPARRDAPAPRADAPAAPAPQRPGPMLGGHHAGAAGGSGGRDYKLFVPQQAGARPLPLVVMLHGCTQDADDFATGTAMNDAAQARGFFVLYPEQSARANPQRCWNWFKHSHQQHGRGEPALVAGMVRELMAVHAIDPDRVYVAGLSAGGAMAAILGDAYPDVFAAVGVHSGLPTGAATDVMGAFSAMRSGSGGGSSDGGGGMLLRGMRAGARPAATPGPRRAPPTIVFHGDADATVNVVNGEQVVQACVAGAQVNDSVPAPVEERMSNNGRTTTRRTWHDANGRVLAEHWLLAGAGHAWSGGSTTGTYADARGPDATREMLRFFHALDAAPVA